MEDVIEGLIPKAINFVLGSNSSALSLEGLADTIIEYIEVWVEQGLGYISALASDALDSAKSWMAENGFLASPNSGLPSVDSLLAFAEDAAQALQVSMC